MYFINLWGGDLEIYKKKDIQQLIKNANGSRILWFSWRYLYKRSFLLDSGMLFSEKLQLGEETPFNLDGLLSTDNDIVYVHKKLYYYVQHKNSLTHKKYSGQYWKKLESLYLEKINIYSRHDYKGFENDLNLYTINHTIPLIISNEMGDGKGIIEKARYFKDARNSIMIKEAFQSGNKYRNRNRMFYLVMLLKYHMFIILSILCR